MTVRTPASMAGQKRVFDSVFPSSRLKDLAPTPLATPMLGQAEFGQSFGDEAVPSFSSSPVDTIDAYPEQIIWDRAWHAATSFLTLPGRDFVQRWQKDIDAFAARFQRPTKNAIESLRYVISNQKSERGEEQKATGRPSLLEWYTDHVRGHYLAHSRASLSRQLRGKETGEILLQLRNSLELLQSIYTYPLTKCLLPLLQPLEASLAEGRFQRDLHALAAYALPQAAIRDLLTSFLSDCSRKILGVHEEEFEIVLQSPAAGREAADRLVQSGVPNVTYRTYYPSCVSMTEIHEAAETFIEPEDVGEARIRLLALMQSWSSVGLGGDVARKTFAAVLDKMLSEFVNWSYAGVDDDESGVLPHLRYWVENVFARYAVQVLDALSSGKQPKMASSSEINLSDLQDWQEMALTRLGALRVDELFDIIMDWDSTKSRVDDLKHYITNPSTRSYLTSRFIGVLSSRLLQPGVSTLHILRLYISIIRAFRRLDPRDVLLDRVARPVRRYLRDRDDTVRVIVTGLFSDAEDEVEPIPADSEVLNELALELKEHGIENARDDEGDVDWNNMDWVPDPIDAAPDYKKSKNFDVIGSLMSLFESKDAIVKELQTMLSDRLLRGRKDFDQETTVLELLKIRFGESVLQNCTVMLRDVKRESVNVNQVVRREQGLDSAEKEPRHEGIDEEEPQPDMHAKILSHLFWPTLQDQTFKVPTQIRAQQHLYEKGFSALKQSRKLTWLNALGQVEIELEFQDRSFKGEVTPWEASVIHAFESDSQEDGSPSPPVSRTVEDLAAELEMSPLLVRSACKLWLSKSILTEKAPDTYQVLEELGDGSTTGTTTAINHTTAAAPSQSTGSTGAAASSAAIAAAESAAASLAASSASQSLLQQKMAVYHQFILSLLTNQGAMPLPRIVMMLGMVVPGGFPFTNEELKEFLARMVKEGEVELGGGGVYRALGPA